MIIVTQSPLDPAKLYKEILTYGSGSVLFHYAIVKNQVGEGMSSGICFERNGDIEAELNEISFDIKSRWNINDILLARRIGTLQVNDVISLIAISAAASRDAFDACRYGLDRLKKMVTLKKTEILGI